MTYTQRMHDALKRLGKQRQEEGKLPSQYDDLVGEIDRLNNEIEELKKHQIPYGWICHPGGGPITDEDIVTTISITSNDDGTSKYIKL